MWGICLYLEAKQHTHNNSLIEEVISGQTEKKTPHFEDIENLSISNFAESRLQEMYSFKSIY